MNIGFIPIRKGSKGIPGKNTLKVLGRPLYTWVLGEAIKSNLNKIFVYSDDDELIQNIESEYAYTNKVIPVRRTEESATDIASTEKAIEDFIKEYTTEFTTLTLLQATSPLTTYIDINNSLSKVINEGYDSCLSVVNSKRFSWDSNGNSLNYNYLNRPRRQDFDGLLIENGAVYTVTKKTYKTTNNRLGGKIGFVIMADDTLTEIDELSDLLIIENLLKHRLLQNKVNTLKIKAFVIDVDGVLTDGKTYYSGAGEFSKSFDMRDGMGLENARFNNIDIIILTSENSPIVSSRMEKLKIKNFYLGVKDKYLKLDFILKDLKLARNEVLYIGDDINDLSNILSCGWGICPNDATDEVKSEADIILNNGGGNKAIREAVRFALNYNKRFL
jgi:YrbI family 3-deoxy-D-manno-octulosonate 8-phosphate phosphatase